MKLIRTIGSLGVCFFLASCAIGPDYRPPEPATAPHWQAPLPHGGTPAALVDWWRQFDDPLIADLIAIAERDSPTLDAALARIDQSRAAVTVARSTLFPAISLGAGRIRSGDRPVAYEQTVSRGSFDASWELDLFGGNRRGGEAAEARLQGVQAAWHDARISLAAEIAMEYSGLRSCQARLGDSENELASRRATERLTLSMVNAGLASPADGALAQASAAEGALRGLALRVECDIGIKALVALTGVDEPELRRRLAPNHGRLPQPAMLTVNQLPARVIRARPDIVTAERNLAATSAEIGAAEAARYPRLYLLGTIGRQHQRIDGTSDSGSIWSFGPTLDLPIFDAGRRAADVDAARARYDEALAAYKGRVRNAVREVEEALVRLGTANERENESRRASENFDAVFSAAEQRWQVGIGSQLDLEETRRLAIVARSQHRLVQYNNVAAWIGLYRSTGGGWTPENAAEPKP